MLQKHFAIRTCQEHDSRAVQDFLGVSPVSFHLTNNRIVPSNMVEELQQMFGTESEQFFPIIALAISVLRISIRTSYQSDTIARHTILLFVPLYV